MVAYQKPIHQFGILSFWKLRTRFMAYLLKQSKGIIDKLLEMVNHREETKLNEVIILKNWVNNRLVFRIYVPNCFSNITKEAERNI